MIRLRRRALVIAAAMAVALVGSPLWAAEGVSIGVVDMAKVYQEAPRVKQLREQLEKRRLELGSKLDIRSQNLMLTEDQVRELIDLKTKANPTEQDKARIKQLTDIERANDEELKRLQAATQLADQEKARLKELQEMQQKAKTIGEQIEKDYNTQLTNEAIELEKKALDEVVAVIKKVGEDKKLQFVLDKTVVFVGGIDVTSEVIAKLDRKSE